MTNFSLPFALTPGGSVQTTDDPNVIANDRVESLVGTFPGERVMLPDYGVNLPAYIFAPDITAQEDLITLNIQQAVNQWEPTIILSNVSPNVAQEDVGIVGIDVQFSLSTDPSVTPPLTATVEVGGNVVQN